jgi:hypothetical protein
MCGCSSGRQRSSYEYKHPFKPENTCGCGIRSIDCDTPSLAIEGSARWKWEQEYGKLVTNFIEVVDTNGHTHYTIERVPCPKKANRSKRNECCSVRYQFVR